MYMKIWTTLLALPLLAASCSDAPDSAPRRDGGTISVTVGSGPRICIESQTRTELGDDGVTVGWSDGDKLALWAMNSKGEMAFSAAEFSLWHYNATFGNAMFRGEVPLMEEDAYTYYAVSPLPAAVSGTLASYDIPAVQDGTFDGTCDVMVASPVQGSALVEGDNSDALRLVFSHKIHVLKIRIPSSKLGEPVSRLEIVFPKPVTGRLTVDAADPDADPLLSEGSNTLTLAFPEPVEADAGQERFVYAMIAPVEIPSNEKITVTAIGSTCESKPGTFAGKNFAAGHTTPIALHVPEAGLTYTQLRLRLADTGEETLGERITSFTLTTDEPLFDNGESSRTFAVEGPGDYVMTFREFPTGLQGRPIAVAYESENALVSGTFTAPAEFTAETANDLATLSVPWLLAEDFSGVGTFNNHCSIGTGTGSADAGNPDAISLSGVLAPGWTAARVGGEQGKAIRIACRFEGGGVFGASAYVQYPGRADSAPLGIKPGKTAKVKVSFKYTGGQQAWQTGKGGTLGNPIFAYGYTTLPNGLKGDSDIETTLRSNIALATGDSWDQITNLETFVIDQCVAGTRISWKVNVDRKGPTGSFVCGANGDHWLYLDDVKVSIANQ